MYKVLIENMFGHGIIVGTVLLYIQIKYLYYTIPDFLKKNPPRNFIVLINVNIVTYSD